MLPSTPARLQLSPTSSSPATVDRVGSPPLLDSTGMSSPTSTLVASLEDRFDSLASWLRAMGTSGITTTPTESFQPYDTIANGIGLLELLHQLEPVSFPTNSIEDTRQRFEVIRKGLHEFFQANMDTNIDMTHIQIDNIVNHSSTSVGISSSSSSSSSSSAATTAGSGSAFPLDLFKLVELCLLCAIHSHRKEEVVDVIMSLTDLEQSHLMYSIHDASARYLPHTTQDLSSDHFDYPTSGAAGSSSGSGLTDSVTLTPIDTPKSMNRSYFNLSSSTSPLHSPSRLSEAKNRVATPNSASTSTTPTPILTTARLTTRTRIHKRSSGSIEQSPMASPQGTKGQNVNAFSPLSSPLHNRMHSLPPPSASSPSPSSSSLSSSQSASALNLPRPPTASNSSDLLQSLQSENTHLKEQLAKYLTEERALQSKHESDLGALQVQLAFSMPTKKHAELLREQQAKSSKAIYELEERNSNLESQLESLDALHTSVHLENKKLVLRSETLERDLAKALDELEVAQVRLDEAASQESKITKLKERLTSLQNVKSELSRLEEAHGLLQTEVDELRRKDVDTEQRLKPSYEKHKALVLELQSEVRRLRLTHQTNDLTMADLNQQLQHEREQVAHLTKQLVEVGATPRTQRRASTIANTNKSHSAATAPTTLASVSSDVSSLDDDLPHERDSLAHDFADLTVPSGHVAKSPQAVRSSDHDFDDLATAVEKSNPNTNSAASPSAAAAVAVAAYTTHLATISSLESQLTDAQLRIAQLENELASTATIHASAITALQVELSDAISRAAPSNSSPLPSSPTSHTDCESKLVASHRTVSSLTSQLTSLESQLSSLQESYADLHHQFLDATAELSEREHELTEVQRLAEEHVNQLTNDHSAELDSLKSELNNWKVQALSVASPSYTAALAANQSDPSSALGELQARFDALAQEYHTHRDQDAATIAQLRGQLAGRSTVYEHESTHQSSATSTPHDSAQTLLETQQMLDRASLLQSLDALRKERDEWKQRHREDINSMNAKLLALAQQHEREKDHSASLASSTQVSPTKFGSNGSSSHDISTLQHTSHTNSALLEFGPIEGTVELPEDENVPPSLNVDANKLSLLKSRLSVQSRELLNLKKELVASVATITRLERERVEMTEHHQRELCKAFDALSALQATPISIKSPKQPNSPIMVDETFKASTINSWNAQKQSETAAAQLADSEAKLRTLFEAYQRLDRRYQSLAHRLNQVMRGSIALPLNSDAMKCREEILERERIRIEEVEVRTQTSHAES